MFTMMFTDLFTKKISVGLPIRAAIQGLNLKRANTVEEANQRAEDQHKVKSTTTNQWSYQSKTHKRLDSVS